MVKEALKTIKCKLKDIFYDDTCYEKFLNCIKRTNLLSFNAYNFMRFYILRKFNNNEQLEDIDLTFIRGIYEVMTLDSRGPKNKNSFDDLTNSFDEFTKITEIREIDASNLSNILDDEYVKILTSYRNNIKMNFFKHLYWFVNKASGVPEIPKIAKENYFKLSVDEQKKYTEMRKKIGEKRKLMFSQLKQVKLDILDDTLKSLEDYHTLIIDIRDYILPKRENISLMDDVKENPFKYLKAMLKMERELEESNDKVYQTLPLRTEFSLKYVSFNTGAIKDIFGEVHNGLLHKQVWNKYFKFNWNKFKIKNYVFNEQIQTDGFSVSIIFREKKNFAKKQNTHEKMAKASKEGKRILKTMTKKDIEKRNKEKERQKELKKDANRAIKKKQKEEFKRLPKERQNEIKLNKRIQTMEFPYLVDLLNDKTFKKRMKLKLKEGKLCFGDPGNKAPITLNGTNGIFNYRNRRRNLAIKRSKYNRLIQNKTNKIFGNRTLKKLYGKLKTLSTKTSDVTKFNEYLKIKYKLLRIIMRKQLNEYRDYLMKLRWFSYINKRRHEDKLLNEIEKKYGSDTVFVLGDWSRKDKIKGLSAPNMGIKRLLDKRFEVYLIDECGTSKRNHITKEEMKHPKVDIKIETKEGTKTISKEIYSVFMFTTKDETKGYINRDYNATINMKTITESEINGKGRPKCFQRQKTSDSSKEGSKNNK
jgi:hypothetical protein